MARIRTVKPEFFTSGSIAELSFPARLLFIGLWCEADREGRFQWSPRSLKLRYLPADDVDGQELLDELARSGLIVYYEAEGMHLGLVRNFLEHQKIDDREARSKLPPPPDDFAELHVITRNSALERNGKEGNVSRTPPTPPLTRGDVAESRSPEGDPESRTDTERTREGAEFREAFEAWKSTLPAEARDRVKPTKDRRAKYSARRREGYTHEQILAAVTQYVNDPWEGRLANATARDFTTLLRNGGQVEKFSAMKPGGQSRPRKTDPRTEADLLLLDARERMLALGLDDAKKRKIDDELSSALDRADPVAAVREVLEHHAL